MGSLGLILNKIETFKKTCFHLNVNSETLVTTAFGLWGAGASEKKGHGVAFFPRVILYRNFRKLKSMAFLCSK